MTPLKILQIFAAMMLPAGVTAVAQQAATSTSHDVAVGIRYAVTEANAPPGTCGCFFLQGGTLDAAIPVIPRLSLDVEVAGAAVGRIPGSTGGLSEITLMAGPRYTRPLRRVDIGAQAIFGAAHGFDSALNPTATGTNTATNFAMAMGGFVDVHAFRRVSIRAAQVDFLQTNLPNGADNRQKNLRISAGVVFYVPVSSR